MDILNEKFQGTSGPWVADIGYVNGAKGSNFIIDTAMNKNDNHIIAQFYGPDAKSNQLMSVASTDLYDACHKILAGWETKDMEEFTNGLDSAKKAMAKALGKS